LPGHVPWFKPDFPALLEAGFKKGKLRAHSDMMWNDAVNDWALEFLDYADIMVESKHKNLASIDLYKYHIGDKQWLKNGLQKDLMKEQLSTEQSLLQPE
jgi:hypothetical protein